MNNHKKEKKIAKNIFSKIKVTRGINNAKSKFLEMTDLPMYLNEDITRISMFGHNNMYIEQYINVIDYFNHYIKIRCKQFDLIIEGKKLSIDNISQEELIINGNIDSISYKDRG